MMLDERLTASVVLTLGWFGPGSGAVQTVFTASPLAGAGAGAAFRIERFDAGPLSWARLVAIDGRDTEIVGRWLPVTPGTYLTLALADTPGTDGDGGEADGGVDGAEAGGGVDSGGGESGEMQLLRTVFLMAPGGDLQIPLASTPDAYRIWSAIPVTITPLGN